MFSRNVLKFVVLTGLVALFSGCPQKRQRPPVNFNAPVEQPTPKTESNAEAAPEENKKGEIDLGIEGESNGPIVIDSAESKDPTTAPVADDTTNPESKPDDVKPDPTDEPETKTKIDTNQPTGDLELNIEQKRVGERPPKPACKIKKPKKDGLCPMNFKPVCGCDEKTYGNTCQASVAGVPVWYEGKCD